MRYLKIMLSNATSSFLMLLLLTKTCHHGIACAKVIEESCPPPPPKDKTKAVSQTQIYREDQKFQYSCIEGYVRKAGTSTQIRCRRNGSVLDWDDADRPTALVCIPDPKRKKPPEDRTSTPVNDSCTRAQNDCNGRSREGLDTTDDPCHDSKNRRFNFRERKTTINVQLPSLAPTAEPESPKSDSLTRGKTTALSLGVIVAVISLIALTVVVLRKRRDYGRFRLPQAQQGEEIPMDAMEGQEERYVPVPQEER
ncbi:hypothetical protein GJAV_G00271100 [Gymnothorax javanicus]|nr:hypothetical protein GJAV_G00271100 [Gymnothorax javanicus]